MCVSRSLVVQVYLWPIATMCVQSSFCAASSGDQDPLKPLIALVGTDLSETNFRLRYEITNRCGHDIWLCDIMDAGYGDFEICWDEGAAGFLVSRRGYVKRWVVSRESPLSHYVRLRPGERRMESMLLPVPLRPHRVVRSATMPADVEYVGHMTLEIGYYEDSVAKQILGSALSQVENCYASEEFHVALEEGRAQWTEGTLRLVLDNVHVPCYDSRPAPSAPDLSKCTRLEVSFEPSMLAYFFPYPEQQAVLNAAEEDSLKSAGGVEVNDSGTIAEFARWMARGKYQGLIAEGPKGHVVCYEGDRRLISFDLYDRAIVTDKGSFFYYPRLSFRRSELTLKPLVRQVLPFSLRLRCARNLVDLRSQFEYRSVRERITNAGPGVWCDAIVQAASISGDLNESILRPFRCPGADDGKCHYAMNPDCRYDSPADTVLLFETRAGWNQHGGPELFTFDNHDPKGGLVLLNDGTVKFIRTEEELKQLRWK